MVHSQKSQRNNAKLYIRRKYSCYIYGEGRKDTNFIKSLRALSKFKYHTQKWTFNDGNASGSSAKIILEKCRRSISLHSYDLVLCFIDLDDLKHDYPKTWEKKKLELVRFYSDISIIWQVDNLEDEHKRVLGEQFRSKHKTNKLAKKNIEEFINSDYWKKILNPIQEKQKELENA